MTAVSQPNFFSFRGALKGQRIPTNDEIEAIAAKEAVDRYLKTKVKEIKRIEPR